MGTFVREKTLVLKQTFGSIATRNSNTIEGLQAIGNIKHLDRETHLQRIKFSRPPSLERLIQGLSKTRTFLARTHEPRADFANHLACKLLPTRLTIDAKAAFV